MLLEGQKLKVSGREQRRDQPKSIQFNIMFIESIQCSISTQFIAYRIINRISYI